jgi:pimeloyl-ACP methyl ester carboxylesterase
VSAPAWSATGATSYRFSADEHASVLNSLRDATKRFSVDTDRVFLSGLAAGADAAWDIGLAHPDLWAGVIPVCPQVDNSKDTDRYISWYRDNARGLPFYFVFGEKDGLPLTARFGKLAEDYIRGRGYDCAFVEYQGRGLEDYFEEVIEMFRWMELYRRDFKKKEFEEFTTMRPTDNFAWCLEIDEFAPRWIVLPLAWPPPKGYRASKSSVKIVDSGKLNVIHLNCDGDRVTLWLSPDFVDFEKPIQVNRSSKTQVKQKPDIETLLEDVRTRGDRQHPFWMRVTL